MRAEGRKEGREGRKGRKESSGADERLAGPRKTQRERERRRREVSRNMF